MINGVLEIVAAVLFAVIAVDNGMNKVWFCVAAVYLAVGILNLIATAIKNGKKQKAAAKQAEADKA